MNYAVELEWWDGRSGNTLLLEVARTLTDECMMVPETLRCLNPDALAYTPDSECEASLYFVVEAHGFCSTYTMKWAIVEGASVRVKTIGPLAPTTNPRTCTLNEVFEDWYAEA